MTSDRKYSTDLVYRYSNGVRCQSRQAGMSIYRCDQCYTESSSSDGHNNPQIPESCNRWPWRCYISLHQTWWEDAKIETPALILSESDSQNCIQIFTQKQCGNKVASPLVLKFPWFQTGSRLASYYEFIFGGNRSRYSQGAPAVWHLEFRFQSGAITAYNGREGTADLRQGPVLAAQQVGVEH